MRDFITKPADINKIEYWAATTVFVFSVFFLVSGAVNQGWKPNEHTFNKAYQHYSFFANYFIPQLIRFSVFYLSYLLLTTYIIPPISRKQNVFWNLLLAILIFSGIGLVLAITDTWLRGYEFSRYKEDEFYELVFQDACIYAFWLMMMFFLYQCIKHVVIYLLENTDLIQAKYKIITRDGIYAFILWMLGLFLLLIAESEPPVVIVVGLCSLFAICLYCYSLYELLPAVIKKGKTYKAYLLKVSQLLLLSIIPVSLIVIVLNQFHHFEIAIIANLFNFAFQLLFTAPLSWYLYKHRLSVDYEITGLKTALGRSTADLNFLRSQINPHFLFNILNTLYGTALQENADRTSQGIQKLGDMMRFMLHENLQEKIFLSREIDYLSSYISLQTLRTQLSPEIQIQVELEEHLGNLQIAPMLLIPFVENAFKHGISLKERSDIRISLQTKEKTLYFDVSNTIHPKQGNDPEKDSNGIGLTNVKQRLNLVYPNRHQLTIHEGGSKFFVHLIIQLD